MTTKRMQEVSTTTTTPSRTRTTNDEPTLVATIERTSDETSQASDSFDNNNNNNNNNTTTKTSNNNGNAVVDDDVDDDSSEFVDYTAPPEAKILPPAKYKLWLIVFVMVYFASWVATEAKLQDFLRFRGWLSPEASLFLMLAIIVFVLVYTTMDLIVTVTTFHINNNEYGIGAWLKQPRAQWPYHYDHHLIFQILSRIVYILEEGFSMFDAPPSPPVNVVVNTTGNNNTSYYNTTTNDIEENSDNNNNSIPKQFVCKDRSCQRTLKIEHRIKADKLEEYEKWATRIQHAVQQTNGLLGTPEATKKVIEREMDEERGYCKQVHVIVYVKFANIDYLNGWMLSPRRKALMKALEPLLAEPDIVKIRNGTRALPNAFSDLLTRQGDPSPKSPPKKWKVWWLTLIALFLTIRWSNNFLPYYYEQWGLADADERLKRLVSIFISTFLNSYITVPLFLFVFDHWLKHSDIEVKNTQQPWKTFDVGFSSIWSKLFITVAFYGGCVIALIVKRS